MRTVYYINGLGGHAASFAMRLVKWWMRKRGIFLVHIPIDWRASISLEGARRIVIEQIESDLKAGKPTVIAGVSAGGSLALAVLAELPYSSLRVVTICSRLNEHHKGWLGFRTLDQAAHMGTNRQSSLFKQVVGYTSERLIPSIHPEMRDRIVTITNYCDWVVPYDTMKIAGVREVRLWSIGHVAGIITGLHKIDRLVPADFCR